MSIHSTRTPKTLSVIAVFLFCVTLTVNSQFYPIRIDITVVPPYTSNLNDYINSPNKVIANISYASMDFNDVDVYLKGSITSDNGIEIRTKDSYKPANPLHLTRGMVYTLTPNDLSDMFDMNELESSGISLKSLFSGAGLPEDNYQICIRVYDYDTDRALSNEEPLGCSNYFMVTNFEPPLITTPFCGDSITISPIQNAMISWTTPAGAIGCQYKFELIEIPEGIDIDPNDAFQSSFQPVFEEDLSVNIINLTTDKVLLTPGYTYAFRVQATDPMENYFFRNSGYSEVCFFVCKGENTTDENIDDSSSESLSDNLVQLKEQFEFVPSTVISGRLLAKFPDSPHDGNILLENFGSQSQTIIAPNLINNQQITPINSQEEDNSKQGVSYNQVSKIGKNVQQDVNSNSVSNGGTMLVSESNVFAGIGQVSRKPYYKYGNTEEIVNVKALANMEIRLVARWAFKTSNLPFNSDFPEYRERQITELFEFTDLEGNESNPTQFENVVLATTSTDESGNFSFNFSSNFVTGNAYVNDLGDPVEEVNQQDLESQVLGEIEAVFSGAINQAVVNPMLEGMLTTDQNLAGNNATTTGGQQLMSHAFEGGDSYSAYFCLKIEVVNPKFCSPDIDIFAMPGDVLEVPTQVAKLKTYNLKVITYAPDKKHQTAVANEPMDNVRVSIMRDEETLDNENELILNYEGQRLKTKTMNNNGNFKDVAIDTSGAGVYAFTYFKNLIKHANVPSNSSSSTASFSMPQLQFTTTAPQYFIEISTRNDSEKEDEYEFTRYNYKTIFKELETTNFNNAKWPSLQYNHQYEVPEIVFNYTLEAKQPEIKARVMTKTNYQVTSIKDVRVELYAQNDSTQTFSSPYQFLTSGVQFEDSTHTNNVGIFRFEDLNMDENAVGDIMGPFRRTYITHPGYKEVTRPIPGMKPWNLSWGMLKDIKDVYLEPADSIIGLVEDEDGNPVSSYVKSEYSPYYSTYPFKFLGDTLQFFGIPSVHHGTRVIVHPKSSQYFSRDTVIGVNPNKRIKIRVYKKLHRPEILITNKSGVPITGAIVELGEQIPDTTDSKGFAKFKFASPGDQFIVKITPPQGYAPMQAPIQIPVTPGDTLITYKLEYANQIKGTITEKDSNTPIPDALIYSELENTDGTILYIEAKSNQNGDYVLGGIPKNLSSLKVHVVKQGNNPSYVGTSKNITFSQSVTMMPVIPTHNFELKRMDDWNLSEIWGYPAVINQLSPSKAKPDEYIISGYFLEPPLVAGFTLQQPDVKFNFTYLPVKKSTTGKIEPVNNEIELDVNKIPLFINNTFAGTLYNQTQTHTGPGNAYVHNTYGQHKIIKESNTATLQGICQINLETFRNAYDFNGDLYIGDPSLGNKVKVFSKVLDPNLSSQPILSMINPKYNVFSLSNISFQPAPIRDFRVFGFSAFSDNENTFLQNNEIYIQTILNTDIPTCNTCSNLNLEIPVGRIVISKDDIKLIESPNDSLIFTLEDWKVYNKGNWHFDKNEEAIVLENVLIVTGKSINASVKDLKIWPTIIGEGTIDLSNGGLSLGGIAQIKLNKNLTPVFNYDPIGHYRISVVGSLDQDVPAGTVSGLPEMNDDLEFEAIGLLSNGKDILTINKTFRFYDIVDIEVTQIVSGNGYFDLQGNPILGVPGLIPEETAMRYLRNEQGTIVPQLQPIKGGLDAPGYVYFSLDEERTSHSIKEHEYKGYGTLYISPGTNPSDSRTYKLRGELIKTNNQCKIEVFKVDPNNKYRGSVPQNMIVGNNSILVTDGYLNTSNNAWDSLVYFGNTASIDGFKNADKPENKLTFVVKGDVDVSSSNVEVNNIDVGIGKMSMTYDFDEGSMRGFLEVHNLPIGPAYVSQGQMSINFGRTGYYFALGSESFFLGNAGEFKGGFIFGNSSKIDPVDINFFSKNFKVRLPDFSTEGISGMYAIGEKVFINKSIDLVFAKAAIDAGVGIYVNADFSNSYAFTLGGYGHAEVKGSAGFDEAGVNICSVDVCVSAFCNVEAKYVHKTNTLTMNNCMVLSAQANSSGIGCGDALGAIGVDPSLKFSIGANYGYDGEVFYATFNLNGKCGNGDESFDVSGCD